MPLLAISGMPAPPHTESTTRPAHLQQAGYTHMNKDFKLIDILSRLQSQELLLLLAQVMDDRGDDEGGEIGAGA